MKLCSRCEEEKQLSKFGKNRSRKDGLAFYCKSCVSELSAERYQRHKEHYKKKQREKYKENKEYYKKKARQRRSKLLTEFRGWKAELGCSHCPENHPACIDFHHPGEKEIRIISMEMKGISLERVKQKVKEEQCISMCSNCHRKLHYKEYRKNGTCMSGD